MRRYSNRFGQPSNETSVLQPPKLKFLSAGSGGSSESDVRSSPQSYAYRFSRVSGEVASDFNCLHDRMSRLVSRWRLLGKFNDLSRLHFFASTSSTMSGRPSRSLIPLPVTTSFARLTGRPTSDLTCWHCDASSVCNSESALTFNDYIRLQPLTFSTSTRSPTPSSDVSVWHDLA